MAKKVVFQFSVYGEAVGNGEPDKNMRVEMNPVEGTDEQQPVISVHDRATGLDAQITLPKGDYSGMQEIAALLGQNPEDTERTARKVVALFNLFL